MEVDASYILKLLREGIDNLHGLLIVTGMRCPRSLYVCVRVAISHRFLDISLIFHCLSTHV